MNRHAEKRRHKRIQQKQYMTMYSFGRRSNLKLFMNTMRDQAEEDANTWWCRKHPARNGGWEYWRRFYMSGSRRFAKQYTNRKIRQKYRTMLSNTDHEDAVALHGADYEKEFDYEYTVW